MSYIITINNVKKNDTYRGCTRYSKQGKVNKINVQSNLDILNKTSILAHEALHAIFNILKYENKNTTRECSGEKLIDFVTNTTKYTNKDLYISFSKEQREKICLNVQKFVFTELVNEIEELIKPQVDEYAKQNSTNILNGDNACKTQQN